MHDVAKRGLALAVATGGLLITGAAPAVSAVRHHPENSGDAGKKSQPKTGSSHHAGIPVSGSTVKQYAGRHKAPAFKTTTTHRNSMPVRRTSAPAPAPGTLAATPASPVPGAAPAPAPATTALAEAEYSGGLLAGNTVEVPVDAPLNFCGLVVTVLGGGNSATGDTCVNGPGVAGGPSSSAAAVAAGSPGALSGNVVQVPVTVPANVCGDSATVVGGQNTVQNVLCANEGTAPSSSAARATASSSPGVGSGNIVQVPVDVPVNVCGITENVIASGDGAAGNNCTNGGAPTPGVPGPSGGATAAAATADSPGVASGNVVQVPVTAPLEVCGDTLDVLASNNPALGNMCVNNTAGGAAASAVATGSGGAVAGNVTQVPIDLPAEVCGVVAGLAAHDNPAAGNGCATETGGTPGISSSAVATGESGLVTGTVTQGGATMPVQFSGTTVGAAVGASPSTGTACSTGPSPASGLPLPISQPPASQPSSSQPSTSQPPSSQPPATQSVPAGSPSTTAPRPATPVDALPPTTAPRPATPVDALPPTTAPRPAAPVDALPPTTAPRPAAPVDALPPTTRIAPRARVPFPGSGWPDAAPQGRHRAGELPHTGADVLGLAGIAGGALLVGAGAVMAARRRPGSAD